ncbi:MAG TPA: MBL fold metallo-hydrolase [Desulfobulbaceae bacterium]|nr:MBL fold metallo-hydrolase [Desulfobulbaceae bacterium]
MFFKQFTVPGMGCLSYLIGCPKAGIACVVDPKRDVGDYIEVARENNLKITHIFETHVHADHISGNMELQSRTGAEICMGTGTPATFAFTPVTEGDIFEFGSVKLEALSTPGHTPNSISLLVTDTMRNERPWMVLTGDCMFVGDVGRPDLAGKELIHEQAENLYNSLFNKLTRLPEGIEIFPAHGEGSLCGKGMSSKSSSTVGYEKESNPVFKLSKEEFLQSITGSFPDRPKSFTHIITTNKSGVPLLDRCPVVRDLSPLQVKKELDRGVVLLDTRDTASFGGVHVPGSINIGFAKQTANWIGMVIEPDAELILVVTSAKAYSDMLVELHRIGYDKVIGYLYGGMTSWQEAGMPIEQLWQISARRLHEKITNGNISHFFDVRSDLEWNGGHVREAQHLPLNQLLNKTPDIPKDEEVIVTCGVGYRGNIAASYLQSQGFQHVHSLAGGMTAWQNSGYSVTV